MTEFTIRQGSRWTEQAVTDSDAVSVTLIFRSEDNDIYVMPEVPFVDKVADLDVLDDISFLPVGIYDLQINENYEEGPPDKYPDPDSCDGDDCAFIQFTICEALDGEGGSS